MFRKKKPKILDPGKKRDQWTLIIGDIHGCFDELLQLVSQFDNLAPHDANKRVIALGDLVDRGTSSASVLDWFLRGETAYERYSLRGNHEVMFQRFLKKPSLNDPWLGFGGRETLLSYGVQFNADGKPSEKPRSLATRVPKSHRQFLEDRPDIILVSDYILVHAGIDPSQSLEAQSLEKLHWGPCLSRDATPYLQNRQVFPWRSLIHGHLITNETPALDQPLINLDTGAYTEEGWLSGIVLSPDQDTIVISTK